MIMRITCLVLGCIFYSTVAFAGGQLEQMKQQRAVAMAQAQQRATQQAVAQRQAQLKQEYARQVQQAQAQAVAQRRAQIVAQQQAMAQAVAQRQAQEQAVAQAVAQRRAQEIGAYKQAAQARAITQRRQQYVAQSQAQAYAQAVAQRKMAIATQQVVAGQQVAIVKEIQQRQVQQVVENTVAQRVIAQKQAAEAAQFVANRNALQAARAYNQVKMDSYLDKIEEDAGAEEIASIEDLWASLDSSGAAWQLIVDNEIKTITVSKYINDFKQQGVDIKKSPGHYVNLINQMSEKDPAMLLVPFANVVRIMAVMEYDFDNGMDKDELAQAMLGSFYETNKQRLGI